MHSRLTCPVEWGFGTCKCRPAVLVDCRCRCHIGASDAEADGVRPTEIFPCRGRGLLDLARDPASSHRHNPRLSPHVLSILKSAISGQ